MSKNKIYGWILIFIVTLFCISLPSVGKAADEPKYKLTLFEKGTPNTFKINPAYFHMFFFEQVVVKFGLYEHIGYKDLLFFADTVYKTVNDKGYIRLVVRKYSGKNTLLVDFFVNKMKDDKYVLLFFSNLDEGSNKYRGPDDDFNGCWAVAMDIYDRNTKLFLRDNSLPTDGKDKTELANTYLLDKDTANDRLIPGVLAQEKQRKNGNAFLVMSQYYMTKGDIPGARSALKAAARNPAKGAAPFPYHKIMFISQMELWALEKTLGHTDSRNALTEKYKIEQIRENEYLCKGNPVPSCSMSEEQRDNLNACQRIGTLRIGDTKEQVEKNLKDFKVSPPKKMKVKDGNADMYYLKDIDEKNATGYIVVAYKSGRLSSLQLTGNETKQKLDFSSIRLGDDEEKARLTLCNPTNIYMVDDIGAIKYSYYPNPFSLEIKDGRVYSILLYGYDE